jgi:hypothetical protein
MDKNPKDLQLKMASKAIGTGSKLVTSFSECCEKCCMAYCNEYSIIETYLLYCLTVVDIICGDMQLKGAKGDKCAL